MKPIRWILAIGVVLIVGAVVYSPARESYVRHRAAGHIAEAQALQAQMTSPVAKQLLDDAAARLRFALMRSESTIDEIAQLDASLAGVMTTLKASPPPDRPVYSLVTYDRVAHAGAPFRVNVSIHSDVPQAFLVSVMAEVGLDVGWKSGPMRRQFNQAIGAAPTDAPFEFAIPVDVAGHGWVRTAVVYRLDPTGEGMDLRAPSKEPLPPITIQRASK